MSGDGPRHPQLKAALLMIGVVVLIIVVAAAGVLY